MDKMVKVFNKGKRVIMASKPLLPQRFCELPEEEAKKVLELCKGEVVSDFNAVERDSEIEALKKELKASKEEVLKLKAEVEELSKKKSSKKAKAE